MKKQVNIIIPVHNRWEHTKQTLDSLFKNTNPDLFDLWVVNDGSDNETTLNLERYHAEKWGKEKLWFFLIHHKEAIGPGATRNKICSDIIKYNPSQQYKYKYLYHSDNDVFFKENWLSRLILAYECFEKHNIRVLGASCHPYLQNNEKIEEYPFVVGVKDAVSGYSQLMTWETWEKYGPFDESMRNAEKKIMGSEDWAFCQKIIQDGYKVGSIEPEVVIPTGKTNTYSEKATGHETFKESTDEYFIK